MSIRKATSVVFGYPPPALSEIPPDAVQCSPLVPGGLAIESLPPASLDRAVMLAVPGTLERRHDIAAMLRALAPVGSFAVMAPKDMGGSRLHAELTSFGCAFNERAKRHHRICEGLRPATLTGIEEALAAGAPRLLPDLGLWSQPGIFSWDRIDTGTALLLQVLAEAKVAGAGADFGCGLGVLAHGVLASPAVTGLQLVDIDRRAVEVSRRNVVDPRASVLWHDLKIGSPVDNLDFVVMNPPFHDAGSEDRTLGQLFIRRAADSLRKGGTLWLTANRHLPYENVMKPLFKRVLTLAEADGFKVLSAVK